MAQFLTTKGIAHYIDDIIVKAQSQLFLLSPFLQLSPLFLQRLKDADYRKLSIGIVYGKSELKSEEKKKLAELNNVTLYYCENLHAKCYYNENHMVLTSMNMYEFSEANNREMGILITKKDDEELFSKAVEEVMSIIRSSKKEDMLVKPKGRKQILKENRVGYAKKNRGFCIRCKRPIPHDPKKPHCKECYERWSEYENPLYKEKYCHKCGKRKATSKQWPLCQECALATAR